MTIRIVLISTAVAAAAAVPFFAFASPATAAVVSISAVCLVLWLWELTPPFVPTLLLWALVPLVLSAQDGRYSLSNVLTWAADPVLALFFGGFVLGAATEKHGLGRRLATWTVGKSGGSPALLLLFTMMLTAFLSMWISNIAAAALMFACLRPVIRHAEFDDALRRVLLVGVAIGANLGGIATPIGTGPNAIAIASLGERTQVTFIGWMTFALPLTCGMLLLAYLLLRLNEGRSGDARRQLPPGILRERPGHDAVGLARSQSGLLIVLFASALLWLTEPLHGVPAAVVALAGAALIFFSGLLGADDLKLIDWGTLLLIAGGITLGRLLDTSGVIDDAVSVIPFNKMNPGLTLFILCFSSALLSALMSNTATAVLLIPLATALFPEPSTAILVAVSASFGMPFVISTPPNAMAYGEGGLRAADLFIPGLLIMIAGCILVSLTGKMALNFAGVP